MSGRNGSVCIGSCRVGRNGWDESPEARPARKAGGQPPVMAHNTTRGVVLPQGAEPMAHTHHHPTAEPTRPLAEGELPPAPPLPPAEVRVYRTVFQLWIILFLLTLGAGLV